MALPAGLGSRRADVQAASRAVVGELQTLTAAWLDPRKDFSDRLRKYTTGAAAKDDIESVQFHRGQNDHMVGHLSVAILLASVNADSVKFHACYNDALQDFADSTGKRRYYWPKDGFHRHVIDVTVVRARRAAVGWLVSTSVMQPPDVKRSAWCLAY